MENAYQKGQADAEGTVALQRKGADRLSQIEKEINDHLELGKKPLMAIANHLRAVGQLLGEAKPIVKRQHGQWERWVRVKFNFTPQWANELIRNAQNWETIRPQIETGVSVSRAGRALLVAPTKERVRNGPSVIDIEAKQAESHPDLRKPDPLIALQKAIDAMHDLAFRFTFRQVLEAAKQQASTLGPGKLDQLIRAAQEQRGFWTGLLDGLRTIGNQKKEGGDGSLAQ